MTRRGRCTARIGGALMAAVLLVGCGSGDELPADPEEAAFDTQAPETESTDTTDTDDETDEGGEAVAVELPGLPIGGSTSVVSNTLQCVDVGWSEPPELPGWLGITVTGVGFNPADGFAVSSETCPGAPSCLDPGFRLTVAGPRCVVPVTWTGPTLDAERLMFFTSGVLVCPPERVAECEAFRDAVTTEGAQAIPLDPAPAEIGALAPGSSDPTDSTLTSEETILSPDAGTAAESSPATGPSSAPTADESG